MIFVLSVLRRMFSVAVSIALVVFILWVTHLTVFAQEVPGSGDTPTPVDDTSNTETLTEELPYKIGEILIQ